MENVELTFDNPKEFLDYEYTYKAEIPKHYYWVVHYEYLWFKSIIVDVYFDGLLLDHVEFKTGDFYLFRILDSQYQFPERTLEHLFDIPRKIELKSKLYPSNTQHFHYFHARQCPTQRWRIEVKIQEQNPDQISIEKQMNENIFKVYSCFI